MIAKLELAGVSVEVQRTKDNEIAISLDGRESYHFNWMEATLIARTILTAVAEVKEERT